MVQQSPDLASPITLSALITALQHLGINVAVPDAQSSLDLFFLVLLGVTLNILLLAGLNSGSANTPTPTVPATTGATGLATIAAPTPTPTPETVVPLQASSSSSSGNETTPSGYVCIHCNGYNLTRSSKDTWYTVTAGLSVGVFYGW